MRKFQKGLVVENISEGSWLCLGYKIIEKSSNLDFIRYSI